MMIILHNVVPVFALMALGKVLGRSGFLPQEFFKNSDRLVYFIFFPALLFWKIGGAESAAAINWPLTLIIVGVLLGSWILSLVYARLTGMPAFQVGAFSQCTYRFNTFVGLAVVMSLYGEEGVREFGLMISVIIPTLNVMAVSTLIWFSETDYSWGHKSWLLFKAMIGNPLILGCLAGIIYSRFFTGLPLFFENTFRLLASPSLPLALLAVGNALTFKTFSGHFKTALVCAGLRQVYVPVAGGLLLWALGATGLPLKVALLFLALPTSVSAFILSSQLNSDADLASACIVMSTLVSFFSMSAVLLI